MQIPMIRRGHHYVANGDINFQIIGGTTQPENPKENTLWVDTSEAITGWTFRTDEPNDPVEGMVWLEHQHVGTEFNAITENSIYVKLAAVFQYKDGSWENRDAEIYQNGEWSVVWNRCLFDAGNQFSAITGGWLQDPEVTMYSGYSNTGSAIITDCMTTSTVNGKNQCASFKTGNKINLHNVDLLCINVESYTTEIVFVIHETGIGDVVGSAVLAQFIKQTGVVNIDVSSLDGSYYIIIGAHNGRGYSINKVWLEKETT